MEDVKFIADSKKAISQGIDFKGVKVFELKNDVLTIEMGDGRKFVSPIDELQGTYHTGWGENATKYKHEFKLQNEKGEEIEIKYSDWNGFRNGITIWDERRVQMFDIIESASGVEATKGERIEVIISIVLFFGGLLYFILSKTGAI